jgi:hypothetical protein
LPTGTTALVVEMLGDGVHLHFGEPANAVLGSLDLVGTNQARPRAGRRYDQWSCPQ